MGKRFRKLCDWASRKADAFAIFLSGVLVALFLLLGLAMGVACLDNWQ